LGKRVGKDGKGRKVFSLLRGGGKELGPKKGLPFKRGGKFGGPKGKDLPSVFGRKIIKKGCAQESDGSFFRGGGTIKRKLRKKKSLHSRERADLGTGGSSELCHA